MDMKEKLAKLVHNARMNALWHNAQKPDEYIADLLMEDGVTVQQWISVKDRLPEKDGHYLCNYHFGEYPKMTFTQVLDYYATDIVPHFQHTLGDGSMKVTHWMEIPKLPQPPKGE